MIREAIILAGGLGTRLRSVVPELPKCMAPVLAKPFIGYVIDYLYRQGVLRFIFSLGYKSELLQQYLNTQYSNLDIVFCTEPEPLGTGGAVKLALQLVQGTDVFVLNGDTFFKISMFKLALFHKMQGSDCTLSLKPMKNFSRYGVVEIRYDNSIKAFKEKSFYEEGLISGGTYAVNIQRFLSESLPRKFSFEQDYLEKYVKKRELFALVQDEYFIDIGIPEDYERAQTELISHV